MKRLRSSENVSSYPPSVSCPSPPLQCPRHLDHRRHSFQLCPVVVAVVAGDLVFDVFHVIVLAHSHCPSFLFVLCQFSVLSARGHSFLFYVGYGPLEARQR